MHYYLYKLQFTTAVHFGDSASARSLETADMSFCADTLFSALCHAACSAEGPDGIRHLYEDTLQGRMLISDAMPWSGDALYLPKPFALPENRTGGLNDNRKQMKKLRYIPVRRYEELLGSLRGEEQVDAGPLLRDFGEFSVSTKASITGMPETQPYSVGHFTFASDCGLYIIAGFAEERMEERYEGLLRRLGLGGIGGKVSAGYGKFEVCDRICLNEPCDDQTEYLFRLLERRPAPAFITLTTALPSDGELDGVMQGSTYTLIRRGGFVSSPGYADTPLKKKPQYFFGAGSVFRTVFSGDVFDVSDGGGHPVYRYAKPLLLGVDL